MAVFKFVITDPKTRKSYNLEIDQDKVIGLMGKKIGEKFNADILGLSGYELQITGGTDKDGFPMHPQVHGQGRKKLVLSHPPCFHPKSKGQRKRKTVRGNTLSVEIMQINCKVTKVGKKPLEEVLVKKAEKAPEQPKEEVKEASKEKSEEKPKEVKKEEPKKEEPKPEKPKEEKKETKAKEKKVEKPKEKEGE